MLHSKITRYLIVTLSTSQEFKLSTKDMQMQTYITILTELETISCYQEGNCTKTTFHATSLGNSFPTFHDLRNDFPILQKMTFFDFQESPHFAIKK